MGRGKQQRPAIAVPQTVWVMPTAGGWAQAIAGVGCGRPDPAVVDAEQAKARAAGTGTALARDVHGRAVEVRWEPATYGAWVGRVGEGVAR
ncbi:hypothetical protein [Streptomyces sp. ISL-94]|uniref:hypothetical protein n=1 Tax=Streptomyces sp. ISL-94 TaxID=2819190 RepID=UPI001BEAEB06|nr:hypothetical protein [Streptomyces sp. ISL-94]MBT2480608.1 hypothetical protein [Streptomyces sp. ISL-94]